MRAVDADAAMLEEVCTVHEVAVARKEPVVVSEGCAGAVGADSSMPE